MSHKLVRVVGIGSPHGDDAIGWEVVRGLSSHFEVYHLVHFHQLEGGQHLLEILDGTGILILVDAVRSNRRVGEIVRLEWPTDEIERMAPGTTHDYDPAQALELAKCLGLLPKKVFLIGIEVDPTHKGMGLSKTLSQLLPQLIERLKNEIIEIGELTPVAASASGSQL